MAEVFSHFTICNGDALPRVFWVERTLMEEVIPKQRTKQVPSADKMGYLPKNVADALCEKFLILQQRSTWKDQCQIARWALEAVTLNWHLFALGGYDGTPFYFAMILVLDADHIEIKAIWKSIHGMLLDDVYGCGMDFLRECVRELSPQLSENCMAYVTARKSFINMFATNKVPLQMVGKLSKAQGATIPAQFYIKHL